jgi:hypothetical protein
VEITAIEKKRLKGIGGWLLFFIFTLVFFSPLYQLYDFTANPQFYFWESGAIIYESVAVAIVYYTWGIIVGILLWKRKPKAVIWAKEFLIAALVVSIFLTIYSYGLFSTEDYDLILYDSFRSIVYFGIWFSYLNLSRRVKNTFEDRKLNWKRVIAISGIAIAGVFIISTLISFIPINIENPSEIIGGEPYNEQFLLEGGYGEYHEFIDQFRGDVKLRFESDNLIEVYFVKSEKDFYNFLNRDYFKTYAKCYGEGNYLDIRCTVSSGGIIVYNPNNFEVDYTIKDIS